MGRGFAVPGGVVSSSLALDIVPACLRHRSQGTQGVDVFLHLWRLFGCPSSRRSQAGQQPRCSPDKLAGAGGEVLTVRCEVWAPSQLQFGVKEVKFTCQERS